MGRLRLGPAAEALVDGDELDLREAGDVLRVGGFGITALRQGDITLVPVRTGVGARLGVNVGYLKFTPQATWNPF